MQFKSLCSRKAVIFRSCTVFECKHKHYSKMRKAAYFNLPVTNAGFLEERNSLNSTSNCLDSV